MTTHQPGDRSALGRGTESLSGNPHTPLLALAARGEREQAVPLRGLFSRHWLLLALAIATLPGTVQASEPRSGPPPNILFLFADDQCYETIAALGHTEIETPHLDRLAARGTTFTHAYNMGSWSGAVCMASRAMLVTGRTLWRTQEAASGQAAILQNDRLWPRMMNAAGYDTYFTGKWHIRADVHQAFDVVQNVRGGMPKDVPEGYNRPRDGEPDPWNPSDPQFGGFWEGGRHWSEVVGDDGIEFLQAAGQSDRPFFMYIAFNAPHDPRQSPEEYIDRYPLERLAVPESFLPLYPHKDAIGCGPGLRDERLAPFPRSEHAIRVHRQEYYAIITHMDAQIGRILDALEASDQAENTWIFFTADHGLAVGHHGLLGKQNMYDHSLRVPFLVVGPGVAAGEQNSQPIYLQDVMPTALELAGAPRPEQVEFQSLLPLLDDPARASEYDAIYGAYLDLQRAVVADGFKLIVYPQVPAMRLYHLEKDPGEVHDLAEDPAQAARRRQLFQRLLVLQEAMGDSLDLRSVFPEP